MKNIKIFLQFSAGMLMVLVYIAGFYALLNRALFEPIEINAENPHYSVAWIVAWGLYICLGVGVAGAIRFGSED